MPDKSTNTLPNPTQGLQLEGLADRNMDLNEGLQSDQEQLFSRPFKNDTQIPLTPLHEGGDDKTVLSAEDKVNNWLEELKNSPATYDPQSFENTHLSHKDIPDNAKYRYPEYYPGYNNEDIYAGRQSILGILAKGVGRMVGSATKTFLQGVTEPIIGTAAVLSGGSFYKNEYNQWLESWETAKDKYLPLYESTKEKNAPWYSSWMYANSYAHLLDNIGFMAGMAGTVALTSGIGEALGGASVTGKMTSAYLTSIDQLSEIASLLPELENGSEVSAELSSRIEEITSSNMSQSAKLDKVNETIKDISDKYASQMKSVSRVKQAAYTTASNLGMASGMALQARESFKQKMLSNIAEKNGVVTDIDKDRIEKMSDAVGNWTGAISAVMSAFTLHGLFRGVLSKTEGEAVVRSEIEDLGIKEGTGIGEEKGAEYYAKGSEPSTATTSLGKFTEGVTKRAKSLARSAKKVIDPWSGVGMVEYSLISPSVENYYNKKYETGDASILNDAILPNIKNLADKDAITTFFMGMIAPFPLEVGRKIQESKEIKSNTAQAIDAFNSNYLNSYLKESVNSIKRDKIFNEENIEAIKNGDELAKYNIREQRLQNYIYPRIKYGMKSLIDKDIEGYKALVETPEEFKKLQDEGVLPSDGDFKKIKEDFLDHLKNVKESADRADSYYKAITLKYGGYRDKEGNKLYDDKHVEKLMYISGMTDDATKRIKKLSEELSTDPDLSEKFINTAVNKDREGFEELITNKNVSDLLKAESRSTIIRDVDGEKKYSAEELYNKLKNSINDLLITDDKKDNLRKKLDDLVSLNFLKRNYLKQYHDIIQNPGKYKDTTQEKLINPYTEDYEGKEALKGSVMNEFTSVSTIEGDKDLEIGKSYYSGTPISVSKPDGTKALINDFKIVREDKNGILIKAAGELIHVDKNFLKAHDVDDMSKISDNLKSRFFFENKDNDFKYQNKDIDSDGKVTYSPTKDKLFFNSFDGEVQDKEISIEAFKDGVVQKTDENGKRIPFTDNDKEFLNKYYDELKKKNEQKFFTKLSDELTRQQSKITQDNFTPEETPAEATTEGIIHDIAKSTSFVPDAKKSITVWYGSSMPVTEQSILGAKPEVREWYESRNYWSERVNQFLSNLGLSSFRDNTKLKGKDGNYQQPSIVLVHKNNQDALGLKGLIRDKDLEGKTDIDTPIIMLPVHIDEQGNRHTIDNEGNIKKIDGSHGEIDYNSMVFTYYQPANNKWANGEVGHHTRHLTEAGYTADEIKKIESDLLEQAKKDREEILKGKTLLYKNFKISEGIPIRNPKNVPNPLTDSKILDKDDIKNPGTIVVSTLGIDGKGSITVGEGDDARNITVKTGLPFLKKKNSVILLNSKKFTKKNVSLIYDVIHSMVFDILHNNSAKLDSRLTNYLSSTIFFNDQFSKDKDGKFVLDANGFPKIHDRQVCFFANKLDKKGYLLLGNNLKIPFTPTDIEDNKKQITEFLEGVHHIVSNKRSKASDSYNEITGVSLDKDNKLNIHSRQWINYTAYLLAKDYKDGLLDANDPDYNSSRSNEEIPITSNIIIPQIAKDGLEESPYKGKYITIQDKPIEKPIIKKEESSKKETLKIEEKPKEPIVSTKDKVSIPEGPMRGDITLNGTTENKFTHPSAEYGDITYTAYVDKDNKAVVDIKSISALGEDIAELRKPTEGATEVLKAEIDKDKAIKLSVVDKLAKVVEGKIQKELDSEKQKKPEESSKATKEKKVKKEKIEKNPVKEKDQFKEDAKKRRKFKDITIDPNSPVNMQIFPGEEKWEPIENIAGFKEYMAKVLPQFNVEHMPYILKNGKGGYSWGQYHDAYKKISLSSNAILGTGFHEAFHAVFDSFLSDKEQNDLLNEYRGRPGTGSDRFGNTFEYNSPDLNDDTIIENIADEFREHNISNKIYEKSPVKMGFFSRLKNFIKHFIFGKPETIKGVFDKINGAYYKDASVYNKNLPEKNMIMPDGRKANQVNIRDFGDGVIIRLRQFLGVENGNLLDFNEGKIKVADVFNAVREDLNSILYNIDGVKIGDRPITDEEVEEFYKSLSWLIDRHKDEEGFPYYQINEKNWETALNKVKSRLSIFKFSIVKDLEEGTEVPVPEENNTLEKNPFGIDIFKSDAKDTAPREIQFLFNTIRQVFDESVPDYNEVLKSPNKKTSPMLFNKIVEDNSLFYKTMYSLSGTTNLDALESKFKDLAAKIPALVDTYNALFGLDIDNRNLSQWRMLLKFHKTFTKQNPNVALWKYDENGNSYPIEGNTASSAHEIGNTWISKFKDNLALSVVKSDTTGTITGKAGSTYYTLNPDLKLTEPKDYQGSIYKFFNEIGSKSEQGTFIPAFGITEEKIKRLSNSQEDKKLKSDLLERSQNLYVNLMKNKDKGVVISRSGIGAEVAIRELSEIAAKLSVDKFASQYQRVDGEYVQTNILHNYYSRILSSINEAKTLSGFLDAHPEIRNDVYTKNSILLKNGSNWFNGKGKVKSDLKLDIDTGVRNVDEGTLAQEMTLVSRVLHSLNVNLGSRGRGLFHVFMPADQNSEFGMNTEHYIDVNSVINDKYKPQVETIFKGYLEDEINLIKDAPNRIQFKELAQKSKGPDGKTRPRAEQLRYFKDILSPDLVKLITEYANKEDRFKDLDISYEDFLKLGVNEKGEISPNYESKIETKFKLDLWNHMKKEINEELYFFRDNLMISSDKDTTKGERYKFHNLNTDILKSFDAYKSKDGDYLLTESEIKKILEFRILNTKINDIEFSKVFYGDPAFNKDFTKRAKLLNSGTETNYTDKDNKGFNKFANKELNKSGEIYLKPGDDGYYTFDDKFKGVTFDWGDSKHTMTIPSDINQLIEIFKDEPEVIKAYEEGNNPIDAQSYADLAFYRELSHKSGSTWEKSDEEVFQYNESLRRKDLHERLLKGEKALKEKLGRDSIYETKDGKLTSHGKELLKSDEEVIKNRPDNTRVFEIKKYLGAGIADSQDMIVPNYLKTSTLPLFWELVEGKPALEDLYFFMRKNKVDYTGPESQHKVGIKNYQDNQSSPELYYTDQGEYEDIGKIALHKLTPEDLDRISYEQPLEHFNKIVETAGQKDDGTLGTQTRVLITADLRSSGLPKDFFNEKEDDYLEKQQEWDNLTKLEKQGEIEKRKLSPLYGLYKDMDDILTAKIKRGGALVQDTLGIGIKDDKFYLKDAEKLRKYLLDMSNTFNIPSNIKDALQITKDANGNDTILIDQLPNRDSLEYIVNSILEKKVIRPRMNGGAKILVSGEMFEDNNREALYKEGNTWRKVESREHFDKLKSKGKKIMLSSNKYKFYSKSVDGKKVNVMQIGVTNHFKEKMQEWAKKNGQDLMDDKDLIKYLNNIKEGQQLLKGIGFRIPTQGLNSIDAFEIVEFLSDRLGDAVVVPSELTTKVGSDFDVDKLNTYLKNFYIDDITGMPKLAEFFDYEPGTKEAENALEKIWEQSRKLPELGMIEDVAKDLLGDVQGRTQTGLDEYENTLDKYQENIQKEIDSLENFIKENKGKSPYETNTIQALDNKYLDSLEKVLTHESNYKRLLTPNTVKEMTDIEKDISHINHKEESKDKNINYSNYLNNLWMGKKRQEFLEGKANTSIAASGNTSHAMMQSFPVHLKAGVTLKFDHNQIKAGKQKLTSLSGIVNSAGRYISDMLSQLLNGSVDVAADSWLMRVLPSKSLFSQAMFLLRAGISTKDTFYFLNQPIIQEYIKAYDKNKNLPDNQKKRRKDIISDIEKKFAGGDPVNIDKFVVDGENGMKEILERWHKYNIEKFGPDTKIEYKYRNLTDHHKAIQREILREFIKYEGLSQELFDKQMGSYWGNMKKPTDTAVALKNRVLENSKNSNIIGIDDNLDNTWFGTMKNEIIKQSRILNSVIFKTSTDLALEQLEPILDYVSDPFIRIEGGMDKKISILNRAKSNFIDFLTQNFSTELQGDKPLNDYLHSLFINSDTNLAHRLNKLQDELESLKKSHSDANILGNISITKLMANFKNPNDPHNIEISGKPTTVNAKEDFTSGLEELADSPNPDIRDFYHDLVKLGLLQSGVRNSRISFNELIPHKNYSDYVGQGIRALENENELIKSYNENKVFWRTNWRDDNVVPRVKSKYWSKVVGDTILSGWYHPYIDPKYSDIYPYAKKLLESGNNFLSLHISESKSPVVKIVKPKSINGVELTKEQVSDLRNKNRDQDYYETELYKRVEVLDLDEKTGEWVKKPVVARATESGLPTHYIYKQINAWGDGQFMQEAYTEPRPSILEKNKSINEMRDQDIADIIAGMDVNMGREDEGDIDPEDNPVEPKIEDKTEKEASKSEELTDKDKPTKC